MISKVIIFVAIFALATSYAQNYDGVLQDTGVNTTEIFDGAKQQLIRTVLGDKQRLKDFLVHFIKSYLPRDSIIAWFKLPSDQQQCIENAISDLKSSSLMSTSSSRRKRQLENSLELQQTKTMLDMLVLLLGSYCPDARPTLEQISSSLYNQVVTGQQEFYNSMPSSVQNLLNMYENTYVKFKSDMLQLTRNNKDPKFDQVKPYLQQWIPVLQGFLNIPQQDMQQLSNRYPFLAPILTGQYSNDFRTIVQSGVDVINDGDMQKFKSTVMRPLRNIINYLPRLVDGFMNFVMQQPEVSLPQEVDRDLRKAISDLVDNICQNLTLVFTDSICN